MNVLAVGASRNIGYYAALRLLEKGATVTFLLRSPSTFDGDSTIQGYVASGKAHLVKGDGLKADDVRHCWEVAQSLGTDGRVDLVLFTVGGIPSFSLTQGFIISPPDLVTKALFTLLSTIPPSLRTPSSQPRIITISSTGLTRASHDALPLLLKPLYGYFLRKPHEDKLGAERIVAHSSGRPWTDEEPQSKILGEGWQEKEGLPKPGELKHVVVIRPALLSDGPCKADESSKVPYRVADTELPGGYRVSRRDVAHFMVEGVLSQWDKWEGKCVNIAY